MPSKAEVDKVGQLNEEEEPEEDEVDEITILMDAEEERSTHQEDQSLEDHSQRWGDMCLNYLKKQMIGHSTTRQSTS
jgi:hypothetical protein